MTNAKVYQGFHDDKKVEEHCSRYRKFKTSGKINSAIEQNTLTFV